MKYLWLVCCCLVMIGKTFGNAILTSTPPSTLTSKPPLRCGNTSEGGLTWPSATVGQLVFPEEYCFKSDAYRLRRECVVFNGSAAQWSKLEDSCEVATMSSVTAEILGANQSTLVQLSDGYSEFRALDVYVMCDRCYSLTNLTSILYILNNMLKMNKSVLDEAQNKMFATNLWLQYISSLFYHGEPFISEENLFYFGDYFSIGYVVEDTRIIPLKHETPFQEMLQMGNLQSGIYCHLQIYKRSLGICSGIYFKNDNLFPSTSNVSEVYGLPVDIGRVTIVRRFVRDPSRFEVSCSYWVMNRASHIRGEWRQDGWLSISFPFYACDFPLQRDYIAIIMRNVDSLTVTLQDILDSFDKGTPISEIYGRLLQSSARHTEFKSIDVDIASHILERLSHSDEVDLDILMVIINNLLRIDRSVLFESENVARATDIILYSIDRILKNHKEEYQSKEPFTSLDNFTTLIYDKSNISALLLYNDNRYEVFKDDIDLNKLLIYENLQSAVIINPELKAEMKHCTKIVITIFLNDNFFNEKVDTKTKRSVSKIFGIIIPNIEDFAKPVKIFHQVEVAYEEDECVHWYYDPPDGVRGFWKNNNKSENFSRFIECDYWHTTHFALLLLEEDQYDKFDSLDYITTVNFSISFSSCLLIILTAISFKQWRRPKANKMLIQFVVSCLLQIVAFYVSSLAKTRTLCISAGFFLHYCILSQFCWMLVVAVSQYQRYVVIFQNPPLHVFAKTACFAWGLPILPPVIVVSIDKNVYVENKTGLCYPSGGALYFGVWLPVVVVLLLNICIFSCIIKNVFIPRSTSTGCANFNRREFLYKCRLVFFLFFMLGLTWIFGFLSELHGGIVFAYFFCILATLQGFFMFLFFFVLHKKNRMMILKRFASYKTDSSNSTQ